MISNAQEKIGEMFDRISPTYDILNRLLSFGVDKKWRTQTVKLISGNSNLKLLDLATGTGDLLISAAQENNKIVKGIGIDLAEGMLIRAQKKIKKLNLEDRLSVLKASADDLKFQNESFDIVTIGFGIRNIVNKTNALKEIHRVLTKSGTFICLEFSLPENNIIKNLYLIYFRYFLPLIGGIISQDKSAYKYLNTSVESFLSAHAFKKLLLDSGFKNINSKKLSFGIATIYLAQK